MIGTSISEKFKSDMSDFLNKLGYNFFKVDVVQKEAISLTFYTNESDEDEYIKFFHHPHDNNLGFSAKNQPYIVNKMIQHFNLHIYNYSNDFSLRFKEILEKYTLNYSFTSLGNVPFSSTSEFDHSIEYSLWHTDLSKFKGDLSSIYRKEYDNLFEILIEHVYKFSYSMDHGFKLGSFIRVSGDFRSKCFIDSTDINANDMKAINDYFNKLESKAYSHALKRIGEVTGTNNPTLTDAEFEDSLELLKMIQI
jgi:hypothetical protein